MGRASARSFLFAIFEGGLKPALLFLGCALAACAQTPAIEWRAEAAPPRVEVIGVPLETMRALAPGALVVFAEQVSGAVTPPMAGTVRIINDRLRFEPQFPLARGVRYRAEYRSAPNATPLVAYFELPKDTSPPTTVVTQVYPTADVLPENQLKFYVHFSAPMARGAAYQNVRIRDSAGAVIELPFLELEEELWDPPMQRLTLLIDPGRIKRGVKPLEDIGPVFEAGRSYSLTIEAAWRDAVGKPLRERFEKKFRAGPADRTPPDPKRWKIRAPASGTRDAVVLEFDEPMDQALIMRLVDVPEVAGSDVLENQERRWKFTPAQPWKAGDYRITIPTTIEDLAGNNIGKTFDVDLFEGIQRRIETPVVTLKFSVK